MLSSTHTPPPTSLLSLQTILIVQKCSFQTTHPCRTNRIPVQNHKKTKTSNGKNNKSETIQTLECPSSCLAQSVWIIRIVRKSEFSSRYRIVALEQSFNAADGRENHVFKLIMQHLMRSILLSDTKCNAYARSVASPKQS